MDFYYPNFINDMWRIFGLVFFCDKNHFLAESGKAFDKQKISLFLEEKGIAITDTGQEVVRLKDNASDKFLEIVRTVDLQAVLNRIPDCRVILTAGQKATDTFLRLVPVKAPAVGSFTEFTFDRRLLKLYRMPSSSRAYPKPVEEKAEIYRRVFEETGIY